MPEDPDLLELNAKCELLAGRLEEGLQLAAKATKEANYQRYATAANAFALRGDCAEAERLKGIAAKLKKTPMRPVPELIPCRAP